MSKNLRLVEYFLDSFYFKNPEELEHVISPTFVYSASSGENMNFAQYVERVRLFSTQAKVAIGQITPINDNNFVVEFSLEVIGNTATYGQVVKDSAFILVKENLIENVHLNYKVEPNKVDKFDSIL